jgi:uncharacterized membrane protein
VARFSGEAEEAKMVGAFQTYMVVFRILHIVAGVFWVGSVYFLVAFVQPSAAAIGPAAAPFMGELLNKRRLVDRIIGIGAFTVIAGLFLYWHDSHFLYGSFGDFVSSRQGGALTIGAVSALIALAVGIFATRPTLERFFAIAGPVAASGGPPSPAAAAEMADLQGKLKIYARVSFGFLMLTVLMMASARYLG